MNIGLIIIPIPPQDFEKHKEILGLLQHAVTLKPGDALPLLDQGLAAMRACACPLCRATIDKVIETRKLCEADRDSEGFSA